MKAVIELSCWRGLLVLVPVAESEAERLSGMTWVPVLLGSKNGSPVGTETLNGWLGEAAPVRSRSWSRNWPQAYTKADIERLLRMSSVWAAPASLMVRAP